jgi:hypothetical protein
MSIIKVLGAQEERVSHKPTNRLPHINCLILATQSFLEAAFMAVTGSGIQELQLLHI